MSLESNATAATAVDLQDALERITKIASFQVCYFDDPELDATQLPGDHLDFDFATGTYTLLTPLATVKQNIIKAAVEIERREMLNTQVKQKEVV